MQYTADSEQFDYSWDVLISALSGTAGALLLYGIYVSLFLLSIYTLARRRRDIPAIRFLVAASCVMAVVGTAEISITFARTVVTVRFVQQLVHAQVLNVPPLAETLLTIENVLLSINILVTDSFFIYRCYVIWGCKRKILITPAILILTTLVLSILGSPTGNTERGIPIFRNIAGGLTVAMNVVLTALTAGRIMWMRRESLRVGLDNASYSRYTRAIGLILESGAIYCVVIIFLFTTVSLNDDGKIFYIGFGIARQVLNIIPTFSLVYVGLNDTADGRPTESNRKALSV
ncbi:hypothetical protein MVEN_02352400 [Mycena venus]|uniref:Uncharacterized protein n=1 Tax=Mycena venus TaxID=2733690 RepID=A0A8H6X308_9AGAR|nr:hypothetical protein MVEN_02352400 [Mycena venus]